MKLTRTESATRIKIIEQADDDIEITRADYEGAENRLRLKGREELDLAAALSLSSAEDDLSRAALDEKQAREAIQSGDRHGRDLNRALGQATDLVAEKHHDYSAARVGIRPGGANCSDCIGES